jgi:hypothetical protein
MTEMSTARPNEWFEGVVVPAMKYECPLISGPTEPRSNRSASTSRTSRTRGSIRPAATSPAASDDSSIRGFDRTIASSSPS